MAPLGGRAEPPGVLDELDRRLVADALEPLDLPPIVGLFKQLVAGLDEADEEVCWPKRPSHAEIYARTVPESFLGNDENMRGSEAGALGFT